MTLDVTTESDFAIQSGDTAGPSLATAATGIQALTDEVVKPIVARRLVAARKLSGLDQQQAAARLGYQNSSMLSKIESAQAGMRLCTLQRAALLYGVSMDFLTGLSDYPERDAATCEQLAIMRSLRQELWEETHERLKALQIAGADQAALLAHIGRQRNAIGDAWRQLCSSEKAFDGSLEPELKALAPDLDDYTRNALQRGLRKLISGCMAGLKMALEEAVTTAEEANQYLKRRDALKAHRYLEDVEMDFPLLATLQGGMRGTLQGMQALQLEAAAA